MTVSVSLVSGESFAYVERYVWLKCVFCLGIWAPNCSEWTVTQFATAKIGAILVNINPAYQRREY
jgi:acyl-CoA synthetase (AMP-forming)/AMP-acid ligase II